MRYRCEHCGHYTDGDGDKSTDNLVSPSVCSFCASLPHAGWAANSRRRRRSERAAALDAVADGSFAPGTFFDVAAWRAAWSAGATNTEAARAAARAVPGTRIEGASGDDRAGLQGPGEIGS
jgi:hypothetical protein